MGSDMTNIASNNEQLANAFVTSFARVCAQVIQANFFFDAIIAPGSSGVVMAGLLHRVGRRINIAVPPTISLATFYEDEALSKRRLIDPRSIGLPMLSNLCLSGSVVRCLIVDDEIGTGESVNACIIQTRRILEAILQPLNLEFTIVAHPHPQFREHLLLSSRFVPYGLDHATGETNVIRKYFLESKLNLVAGFLDECRLDKYTALSVALDVPVKRTVFGGAEFLYDSKEACIGAGLDVKAVQQVASIAIDELISIVLSSSE